MVPTNKNRRLSNDELAIFFSNLQEIKSSEDLVKKQQAAGRFIASANKYAQIMNAFYAANLTSINPNATFEDFKKVYFVISDFHDKTVAKAVNRSVFDDYTQPAPKKKTRDVSEIQRSAQDCLDEIVCETIGIESSREKIGMYIR
ncbi:MAG: hypothetical protein V1839_01650 [archaeon]